MSRSTSLVAAVAVAALTLSPSLADARAGSGFSAGSRGGRTYSAPAPTQTAPSYTAPMQRSVTPPSYGGSTYTAPSYRRGGFASGLLGGLLGAGIGGMLFGQGLFGGGGFGFIGFLLQLAIVYFIGRFLFRTFFRRPAMAGMGNSFGRMGQPAPGMMGGGSARPAPVQITPADYQAFEQILQEVQASWSAQDLRRLQSIATPEMVGYFNEQLGDLARKGLRNAVTAVHLDKGDLSESWSENNAEFATVAMRFSMIDLTTDSTGRIVEGDPAHRTTATEVWTFVRSAGRQWQLSAIQQAR